MINFAKFIDERFRMGLWLVLSVLLCGAIYVLAKQQLGVTLYKLSLITIGGYVGYWIDRGIFYYARPHRFLIDAAEATDVRSCLGHMNAATSTMMRRAVIVSACIIAAGLGT